MHENSLAWDQNEVSEKPVMRKKPREEWHNYDFADEQRVENMQGFVIWTPLVVSKFLKFANFRINKRSGIRFKVSAFPSQTIQDNINCVGALAELVYVYPNISPHTSEYRSPYNRLEMYIPSDVYPGIGKNMPRLQQEIDVALSINAKLLPQIVRRIEECEGGIKMKLSSVGSVQLVKKYCGTYTSIQIFSEANPFLSIDSYKAEHLNCGLYFNLDELRSDQNYIKGMEQIMA